MIIFTVLYIIGYTKYIRRKENRANQQLVENSSLIQSLTAEKEQLLQLIHHSNIPQKYVSIGALQTFEQYVVNGRADNLKEAINLYEQELRHQEHMNELRQLKQIEIATYQKADEAATVGWINLFTRR
ncbi:hypothetical protein [Oceanobacillus chungangensis]|uniref:Uncharacterized protein n=1 Tax=Oceanobacillus chungangensis TaxID=1229152 RepID=A0A3D8PN77_9BACI|nr:hypothetical protein [Oceanobacillus chungangensis]RDW16691.1 hypothetical protein CWR45_13755 [Oceanobacillus chungangensis]